VRGGAGQGGAGRGGEGRGGEGRGGVGWDGVGWGWGIRLVAGVVASWRHALGAHVETTWVPCGVPHHPTHGGIPAVHVVQLPRGLLTWQVPLRCRGIAQAAGGVVRFEADSVHGSRLHMKFHQVGACMGGGQMCVWGGFHSSGGGAAHMSG
jgi:hypothetical protein